MVEILFMAQLVRNPLQAMARRWYCRSLFRATRGRRRCAECTGAWSGNACAKSWPEELVMGLRPM